MTSEGLLFGTAGWSFPDWKGAFYPRRKGRGFDELGYHASYFDCVEVNNTFYRPPSRDHVARWAERVDANPRFRFTFKLHQAFTHGDGTGLDGGAAAAYLRALEPAAEAGRLGGLLAQFPWSFDNTESHRRRLKTVAELFHAHPLVVELRHASWDVPAAWDFLDRLELAFCNIDQPRACGSIGSTDLTTPAIAYFRFHGRNRDAWFDRNAGRDARYDYLYSEAELREWAPLIAGASKRARSTFVIGNNHFKGKAPANILQLKALLTGEKVSVPPPLLETYPLLETVAAPS